MPKADAQLVPAWLLAVLALVAGGGAYLFFATRSFLWLGFAFPASGVLVLALLNRALGYGLLALAKREWTPRGVRCVIVHSRSPVWDEYIRSRWLPGVGAAGVRLNWSDRSTWEKRSLEARMFRHFCHGESNFNPAVIVLRGMRRPLVFRFYEAFHEAKHGRREYLESLESRAFEAVGVPLPPAP